MKLSNKHTFYGMIILLVMLTSAIIGGAVLADQQLQRQSAKLTDFKLQAEVLQREQVGLTKAKKDIETYSPLEMIAKTVVPQDKDQAKAVREIIKIAADAGIKPTTINFPASTLGGLSSSNSTAGAVPNTNGVNGPAGAAADTKKSLSQLVPVKGIDGVYDLKITIQLDTVSAVPYAKFIDFLGRLEQNRRTAQVTSILLQPSSTDHNMVSFSLIVDEFIKP